MLRALVSSLACPDCRRSLALTKESDGDSKSVREGALTCSGCRREFPIEQNIARLMPEHLLDAQCDEMAARDAQVAQYDANTFLNVFGIAELPMTLGRLRPLVTERLLEAGCGTGRMTTTLAPRVSELVSVDFSYASLLANEAKLKAHGIHNTSLIQADICSLPLADGSCDRALSCQVLEHVPGDDARLRAVASIARSVRPGAVVVVSGYQFSPLMGAKEGRHDGGIPFFRFTRREFFDTLSSALQVESITSALVYIHLAHCRRPAA